MRGESWVWGFVLAVLVVTSPVSSEAQGGPPDIVRLRNGSFLRGTIVERTDEVLVIMLPTGEVRTYPVAELALVTRAPPAVVPAARGPRALLHVSSDRDDPVLSLHRYVGSASRMVALSGGTSSVALEQFELLCTAPCDTDIPVGTHQLGVGHGTSVQRAGQPMRLDGHMHLHIDYEDRTPYRVIGWTTVGVGGLGGAAMLLSSFVIGDRTDLVMLGVGAVICGASLIIGMSLAMLMDHAELQVLDEDGRVRF